jgi:hypothetical protein
LLPLASALFRRRPRGVLALPLALALLRRLPPACVLLPAAVPLAFALASNLDFAHVFSAKILDHLGNAASAVGVFHGHWP